MDALESRKMCENLVHIASTIGELQHTKYLKPAFLDTPLIIGNKTGFPRLGNIYHTPFLVIVQYSTTVACTVCHLSLTTMYYKQDEHNN